VCACAYGWSPLVRLNRELHLKIFSLSPHQLILEEVGWLWALGDLFISTKMADSQARLGTVEEHERYSVQIKSKTGTNKAFDEFPLTLIQTSDGRSRLIGYLDLMRQLGT